MKHQSPLPLSPDDSFDPNTGSFIERTLFNNRLVVIIICTLLTALLGWQATKLTINASFEKTLPTHQAYIENYLKYQNELTGLGNALRIAVANPKGSIYDAHYLELLREFSDEVF